MAGRHSAAARAAAAGLFVLLLVLPFALRLPEPDALRIDRALFSLGGAAPEEVALPHSWPRGGASGPAEGEYRMVFTAGPEDGPQFLLMPQSRLRTSVRLNGRELDVQGASASANPLISAVSLARLPGDALRAGENLLSVRMERDSGFRTGYMPPVYIGEDEHILPSYRLRVFIADQLRVMMMAVLALLTAASVGLFLLRRHDRIYGWFSLMGAGALAANLVDLDPLRLLADWLRPPIAIAIGNLAGLAMFGMASSATGRPAPRWLLVLVVLWPLAVLAALSAFSGFSALFGAFGAVLLGWLAAAVAVVARHYRATGNVESAMLAFVLALTFFYGIFDIATLAGLWDHGFLIFPYLQSPLVAGVAFILFYRLATSMRRLDTANDTLRLRLAEREAELAEAYEQERVLTTGIAREQERQRLMRDLHDGLSGHIVSIIALAERQDRRDIEQAAREALDDLRLVIHSLDVAGEDISVVLAYFRERAAPQLRRLGIELAWSMDGLPEISGVTSSHALSLLRILQEAVTNAVRHGPARRISITGSAAGDGSAVIAIENDGRGAAANGEGNGLRNMRQRAGSLGGRIELSAVAGGMRLTLVLPRLLPDQRG